MSSSDRHADHEALSGFVDGEAPEWTEHIASCAACQAAVAELRAVAAAVARPVDGPPAAVREAAIAAALGAMPGLAPVREPAAASPASPASPSATHPAERDRFARRRPMPNWAMPAVAAVVVGLLGLSGLLVVSGNRSTDNETTTFAGPALESDAKSSSGGLAAATPAIPATDLGDVPDASTLLARYRAAVPGGPARSSSSSGSSSDASAGPTATAGTPGTLAAVTGGGSGGAGGSAAAVAPPTSTLSQRAASPSAVGPPCDEQVRARVPALGTLVYLATARQGQVDAYVLAYAPVSGPAPLTLFLLAQADCRELLRAAAP
jgi:hypothetical protein